MAGPEEILTFWLDEVGPSGWYAVSDELDQQIRDKFLETWKSAKQEYLTKWVTYPRGALAFIILTDQFPRNMFRGDPKAFSSDRAALAAAKSAIHNKWDLKISEPERQFFYLPLMHSENLCDQERCVRMMLERMPETGNSTMCQSASRSDPQVRPIPVSE